MTDSMPTDSTPSMTPERLHIVIHDLWRLSMRSEERAHRSGAFRALEDTCRSVYLSLEESRLQRASSVKVTPSVLSRALHNFFRWNGAPWFRDRTPDAAETAASLHRAFLRRSVRRTHLVPIDLLSLEHRSDVRTQDVTSIRFGPNEIVRLHRDDLARRVPVDALVRFGARYQFPTAELDGFRWLSTTRTEPAGPLERRTWLGLLNTVELFRSTYPMPVEDALFVLLLILLKDPRDTPWQPFRIPWTFSFTDDLFSDPVAPPDPSSLSRQIVGDEHDQFEVPDQSEVFDFGTRQHWSCPVFVDTFRLCGGGVQMPKTHSPYAPEYRRQMVELVRSGRTPGELAREFECSASAIRNWVRQADRDEGRREDGLTSSELEELRRLRRDNRQLREEREILAKATAWSARETGSVRAKSSSS